MGIAVSNLEEGTVENMHINNRNISIPWNIKLKCLWKKK